jgi:sarcosine oxidase, subunit alpha
MSTRLQKGGRLIDRTKPMSFTFNGKRLQGFAGDTLASALLGADQMLMGRSFKYHRPRGVVASGAEEPNGLVGMGEGARFEPNQRVTTTELFEGAVTASQNHWPSLEFDVGVINNAMARFLPAGFYYKTFMFPRFAWKHVFEPVIRRSAGLGKVPVERDADRYEYAYAFADLVIVGGGIAGLSAALQAGRDGKRVIVLEQNRHWGGRAPMDAVEIDGKSASDWVKGAVEVLDKMANVTLLRRTMVMDAPGIGFGAFVPGMSSPRPGRLNARFPSRGTIFRV